ncbi:hypothetical protein DFH27DRAFT_214389 [Peziza echinospora]|nr:hypothetical protein DFH27DRAFT_214389 [Peziza echinospora]
MIFGARLEGSPGWTHDKTKRFLSYRLCNGFWCVTWRKGANFAEECLGNVSLHTLGGIGEIGAIQGAGALFFFLFPICDRTRIHREDGIFLYLIPLFVYLLHRFSSWA